MPHGLALVIAQSGFVLAAEKPLRRWLQRRTPWTGVVLLNGMIMTIYLWHSSAMILTITVSSLLGHVGLGTIPGGPAWWLLRPVWLIVYAAVLVALIPLLSRFERLPAPDRLPPAWQQLLGALVAAFGLALLAYFGLGGSSPSLLVQVAAVLTPVAGTLLACRISLRGAAS